jgi:hypothetical protein
MFQMNKETIMMVSIAVALFAVFYLYRELQSTKIQVQKLSEPVALPVPMPVSLPIQVPVQVPIKKETAGEKDD